MIFLVLLAAAAILVGGVLLARVPRGDSPENIRRRRIENAYELMSEGKWELAAKILQHIGFELASAAIPDPGSLRAQCLLELDRPSDAARLLRGLVEQPSADAAQRWYWLGEAERRLGRTEQARDAWLHALAADPQGSWGKRAQMCLSSGVYR